MRLVSSLCQFFFIEFGTYPLSVYLNIGIVNSACLRIHVMVETIYAEHLGQCLEHVAASAYAVFSFLHSAADNIENGS